MKQKLFFKALIVISILQSCTKDKCRQTYEGITYTPIYQSMNSLRTVLIEAPRTITSKGKIFVKGNYIYLNEEKKGFHIIDNTNPTSPINKAFVSIPGNVDLIGNGNYLIADNYLDLITFDITNPQNIQLVSRKHNVLPIREYNYGFRDDSLLGVIIGFDRTVKKIEVDCNNNRGGRGWWFDTGGVFLTNSFSEVRPSIGGINGKTGSLSRFTTLNNYLYIANKWSITPIDITNPTNPVPKNNVSSNIEIETMYAYNNLLLAGGTRGLAIFGTTSPDAPNFISVYNHWRGCDPVVAFNNKAYVTLRGTGACGGDRNLLDVLDISNINAPTLIKTYQMENPYGLGIINNKLLVCDGTAGIKLYDATNSNNLLLQSNTRNIEAYDVVMNNTNAIIIAKDGLYQYNISNIGTPVFLSKIFIAN